MSDVHRREQLLDQFLSGHIDRKTYDELVAQLSESVSDSVVSASLIVERSSDVPDVIVATSDLDSSKGALNQPVALVGPGMELGGFRIEKPLGRGGMGEVWRARDLVGERLVVIKLLHPEFVNEPDQLASVKESFQRVHRLQHQNICPLYLLGQDPRFGYYVVMKYIDGLTLSVYRRRYLETHDEFDLNELARVLSPVARALDYAHSQKIIHCDVKPQNIMIGRQDRMVELVDFGLATEIRSSASRASSTSHEHGGTYPYMSPEQWRGEILDGRTDQYALAVVAYELLVGHRPFRAADTDVLRLCALNDSPPPIPGVDAATNSVLLRGMAKSKSDRFESCTAFIKALCASSGNSRSSTRQRMQDDVAVSTLAHANQKALYWISLLSGGLFVLCLGLMAWLLGSIWPSKSALQVTDPQKVAAVHHTPVKPIPVEPALRYRWPIERALIYSVNLDIDQDADRVLTFAGDVAYSVSTPLTTSVPPDNETRGTGTAFVVHPDGYLVTCHHVTEDAETIEVALGGHTYPASLIVDDPDHDLALIRIEARQLPVLPLADSDSVLQGEEVRAIGFPLSSILGENIKATRGTIAGINDEEGRKVFQIDAGINPGNSGGPLVNERGHVVGVIYAKLVDNVASSVGFATPINAAKSLLSKQSIDFTSGDSEERLSGPALVKQVSSATALVTVTSNGGRRLPRGRVSMRCEGTLNPRAWRRSGQPGDSFDQLSIGSQLNFSDNGDPSRVDQVETDSLGRIHAISGRGNLPNFLGLISRLIVETLPSGRQKSWTVSYPITLTVQQKAEPKEGPPWGPRFGPRRFGIPGPFGPRGFEPRTFGREDSEPSLKEYPGLVRIDYELGKLTDHLQSIAKTIDLKTEDLVGTQPRIHLQGQGNVVIDVTAGVPHDSEMSLKLIESQPDKAMTTSMKLTYRLLDVRPLPAGHSGRQAVPPPVSTPGLPVAAESPVEVGSQLVCEWAGKWQKVTVLSLKDDGEVRIHWEGWSDQWDEDVPRTRLRYLPK